MLCEEFQKKQSASYVIFIAMDILAMILFCSIGVLGAEHLIPFKMYAWINLVDRKAAGEHVNERDLKKHKYDVFRLLQIATTGIRVESSGLVKESILKFIDDISVLDESEIRLLQMGLPFDRDQGVELLRGIYL
ncbi:MAG: hypothetical protein K0R69_2497 [Clostridia bacterium]|nr:hypothetical protein [Clostridia bacterium]